MVFQHYLRMSTKDGLVHPNTGTHTHAAALLPLCLNVYMISLFEAVDRLITTVIIQMYL